MGYDRGDSFPFDFELIGIPFGSKLKGKLSPRSYPIQCERKRKNSFLSMVRFRQVDFFLLCRTTTTLHCRITITSQLHCRITITTDYYNVVQQTTTDVVFFALVRFRQVEYGFLSVKKLPDRHIAVRETGVSASGGPN